MTTNKLQNLAPFLKIYKGMKVIIIENTYPKIGLLNGTIGDVQSISLTKSYWI
jgi:ATP-dependent exoDNAse (exonuclease V) alpha subunit